MFCNGTNIVRVSVCVCVVTGLSPEIARFTGNTGPQVDRGATHCILRPETVESYFVMYRLTGDQTYRDWGWEVVQALDQYVSSALVRRVMGDCCSCW